MTLIGFLLLASDSVIHFFEYERIGAGGLELIGSAISRMRFTYFGLCSLAVGHLIYVLRKPQVLDWANNPFDFANFGFIQCTSQQYQSLARLDVYDGQVKEHWDQFFDTAEGRDAGDHVLHRFDFYDDAPELIVGELPSTNMSSSLPPSFSEAKSKYEDFLRERLQRYFLDADQTRPWGLIFSLLFSSVGYLLLAVPAADMFVRVLTGVLSALCV